MLYSFMSFSTPNQTLAEMLETAHRFGYDGVEPRLDSKHAHGIEVSTSVERRREIREMVEASGVRLACLATSINYADPSTVEEAILQTHDRIDLAADVGALSIRVFGGRIPEGITREAAINQLVSALAQIAEHAAERSVTICLETHDDWCDPIHVAAVLDRVNHPAVGANWDIMHPVRRAGKTMDEAFEILKPWIRHLHIHDCIGKDLAPIGSGEIDHRRALELLKSINYAGFLSGEWINWEPWETHLPRELQTMKRYEQELS